MWFGTCCCEENKRYTVFTMHRAAWASSCRKYYEQSPQVQWDEARTQAKGLYDTGGLLESPGPCLEPSGWNQAPAHASSIYNIETGPIEVVGGGINLLGYIDASRMEGTSENPNAEMWLTRTISGHAGMGSGGMYEGGFDPKIGGEPYMQCASASYATAAWIFAVPAPEGASLMSEWAYSMLKFKFRINQWYRLGYKWNIPARIVSYAEFKPTGGGWGFYDTIVGRDVSVGNGFKIVAGNAGGRTANRHFGSARISDVESCFYWIAKHIIRQDYVEITSIVPPPRDGSIIEYELNQGLDSTTTITDADERRLGIPHGSVWFLAIIPEQICMTDKLPSDLDRLRTVRPQDGWFNQMWGDDMVSSINIVGLDGYKSDGTGVKKLVPNNADSRLGQFLDL